jgi:hypothetical protein
MLFAVLLVAFDAAHCTRKCRELFADAPSKYKSCQETCLRDPLVTTSQSNSKPERRQIMSKSVVQCMGKCNSNVNSSTNFLTWSKCRKECLRVPGTNELQYFDETSCVSHCDRYWKGTVHWKACSNQCKGYSKSSQRAARAKAAPQSNAFKVW